MVDPAQPLIMHIDPSVYISSYSDSEDFDDSPRSVRSTRSSRVHRSQRSVPGISAADRHASQLKHRRGRPTNALLRRAFSSGRVAAQPADYSDDPPDYHQIASSEADLPRALSGAAENYAYATVSSPASMVNVAQLAQRRLSAELTNEDLSRDFNLRYIQAYQTGYRPQFSVTPATSVSETERIPSYAESVTRDATPDTVNATETSPSATSATKINSLLPRRHRLVLKACLLVTTIPTITGAYSCLNQAYQLYAASRLTPSGPVSASLTEARTSEYLLATMWTLVCGYLSYSVLDGLIVRWILTYSVPATIVRALVCCMVYFILCHTLVQILSADKNYLLQTWIFIACILTGAFMVQDYVTSTVKHRDLQRKGSRSVNLYKITVFAVVPVGVASFLTMIGLIRTLMIIRLELYTEQV